MRPWFEANYIPKLRDSLSCARRRERGSEDDDERGAVLALLAIGLLIFLLVAALAVDLSALAARGQTLQNTADAAALAGVVEYQEQTLLVGPEAAEALARQKIEDIVRQNGVDPDLIDEIVFPPEAGAGQVRVSLTDEDPASFLGGSIGFNPNVQRDATAQFVDCLNACSYEVAIPRPFSSVSAVGQGDGYKPIAVGQRLYALNHNSPGRKIVCVDRETQEPCWQFANGDPQRERTAYAGSVGYDDRNPEMPHTAVIGTTIYWSASDESGHRLFCWETADAFGEPLDIPCTSAVRLGDDPRIDEDDSPLTSDKDENRGGGTVAVDGRVYVFTDNHEVHCYEPGSGYCSGYDKPFGGADTGLANLGFPDHNPYDGNHGSSIDRVVDDTTGFIYSTIHVKTEVTPTVCTSLDDPDGQAVVIQNAETGRFLTSGDSADEVFAGDDGTRAEAVWIAAREDSDSFSFETVDGEYLDGDAEDEPLGWPKAVSTTAANDTFNQWEILDYDIDTNSHILQNDETTGRISDDDFDVRESGLTLPTSRWRIMPAPCGDPGVATGELPDIYGVGTFIDCWDTRNARPCEDFTPSRLHANGDRFSGRLFFYYDVDSDPDDPDNTIQKLAVCSTGYASVNSLDRNSLEITCVTLDEGTPSTLSANLDQLRTEMIAATGTSPGAWGDPHWNDFTNRMFYPTEHDFSRIICWDFDDGAAGWCGSREGEAEISPLNTIDTEDYGFVSDRNCVFALGHNAYFWAFEAGDPDEECRGAFSTETIERCPCSDTFKWGTLDFSDVDLEDFEEFDVRLYVKDSDPIQLVYPNNGTFWHSIVDPAQGPRIDLDANNVSTEFPALTLEIFVVAENDPFGVQQAFTIRFDQLPRLTE